jgi:hypothetical protein
MNNAKNIRIAAAGSVVALAAAGAAVAATKLHTAPQHAAATNGSAAAFVSAGSSTGTTGGTPRFGGRGDGHFGGPRGDDLAVAATYLGLTTDALATELQSGKTLAQVAKAASGKSESGLVDALVAHEQDELAQAVKDGRLTQAQADQMSAGLKDRVTQQVERTGPPAGGPGFGHGPGGGDDLAAAASYLGVSTSNLLKELQAGKTLGQVADATSGKSKAGLIDALVAHEKSELAQAVKDGHLTQAQADQIASDLTARVTAHVNGTGGDDHGFRGPHGDGDGGFGPPPSSGSGPPATPSGGTHI